MKKRTRYYSWSESPCPNFSTIICALKIHPQISHLFSGSLKTCGLFCYSLGGRVIFFEGRNRNSFKVVGAVLVFSRCFVPRGITKMTSSQMAALHWKQWWKEGRTCKRHNWKCIPPSLLYPVPTCACLWTQSRTTWQLLLLPMAVVGASVGERDVRLSLW